MKFYGSLWISKKVNWKQAYHDLFTLPLTYYQLLLKKQSFNSWTTLLKERKKEKSRQLEALEYRKKFLIQRGLSLWLTASIFYKLYI